MRPQSMVDEQACFGVIVRCPSANFYGYRLAEGDKGAFENLIRPRENFVRYGRPQAVFTDDPAAELDDLCRRSVRER